MIHREDRRGPCDWVGQASPPVDRHGGRSHPDMTGSLAVHRHLSGLCELSGESFLSMNAGFCVDWGHATIGACAQVAKKTDAGPSEGG